MQEFLNSFNVSRETSEKFGIYVDLLTKWNGRINLVAKSTIRDAGQRHILDSAQLWNYRGDGGTWVDLGSGAGFPGMVLAMINQDQGSPYRHILVESDARKCAFLRTVSRETGVAVEIINERVEDCGNLSADVISARALAPLSDLLNYTQRHLKSDGFALYLKGRTCQEEIKEAEQSWAFQATLQGSVTDADAYVLKLQDIRRATESSVDR